jgi:hypothetical protein
LIIRSRSHQAACPFVLQKEIILSTAMKGINGVLQISHWTVPTPEVHVRREDFQVLLPTFRFTDMYVPATPQRYIKSLERSHRRSHIILRSVIFNSCGVKCCCTNVDRNDDQSISQNRARELLDFNLFLFISSWLWLHNGT